MYRKRFGLHAHPLPKDACGKTFYTGGDSFTRLERIFHWLARDPGLVLKRFELRAGGGRASRGGDATRRPAHRREISEQPRTVTRSRGCPRAYLRATGPAGWPTGPLAGHLAVNRRAVGTVQLPPEGTRGATRRCESGDRMLHLRALAQSDRWNDGIAETLRPLERAPSVRVTRARILRRAHV